MSPPHNAEGSRLPRHGSAASGVLRRHEWAARRAPYRQATVKDAFAIPSKIDAELAKKWRARVDGRGARPWCRAPLPRGCALLLPFPAAVAARFWIFILPRSAYYSLTDSRSCRGRLVASTTTDHVLRETCSGRRCVYAATAWWPYQRGAVATASRYCSPERALYPGGEPSTSFRPIVPDRLAYRGPGFQSRLRPDQRRMTTPPSRSKWFGSEIGPAAFIICLWGRCTPVLVPGSLLRSATLSSGQVDGASAWQRLIKSRADDSPVILLTLLTGSSVVPAHAEATSSPAAAEQRLAFLLALTVRNAAVLQMAPAALLSAAADQLGLTLRPLRRAVSLRVQRLGK